MFASKQLLAALLVVIVTCRFSSSEILGHSGIVLHVNKYGHFGGHSSHYDYRFYPDKSLLGHLMDHHHQNSYHHLLQDQDPYYYYFSEDADSYH